MRTLPIVFSQNDPQWQFKPLGDAQVDLGQDGCLNTAFADLGVYYGKDTDPARIDDAFEKAGIFIDEDLLPDNALNQLYSDISYQGSDHYESVPADLGKLQNYLNDPTVSVIVCIDMGGGNVHFSPVVDTDGNDSVTLANPWDGKIESFSQDYGDPKTNILRFIVYKGTPVTATSSNSSQDAINTEKSVQFDQSLTALKNAGRISSDDSNQYISANSDQNNGFLNVIRALIADWESQRTRAGWYDQLCINYGYKGDTTTFDYNQLIKLINSQSSSTTVANLNKQVQQLETQLQQEQDKNKLLTQQLESSQTAGNEPTSGIAYKDLYTQLEKDYNTKKAQWDAQFALDVAVFSQLKTNNIYYLTNNAIFGYWFQRITKQVKQNVPPPLTPADFKYASTVKPPVNDNSTS